MKFVRTLLRLGITSFQIRKKSQKLFTDKLTSCHLKIFFGKKVKIDNNKLTAIQEHLLCCNYSPPFEYFFILTRGSNYFKLKIMESLLIARCKPVLNKSIGFVKKAILIAFRAILI